MAEYIEREAVLDSIGLIQLHFVAHGDNKSLFDIISEAPAADVAPVRHGRWIPCDNGGYYCSYCDHRVAFTFNNRYCPNCGALMQEDSNGKK